MREAFISTLLKEAQKNENIYLITGDLGFGVLEIFQEKLPKQFLNSGVNEQTMMGMAAGIASTGKRVFVYSIGNFSTMRCLEQIRNDVCLMNNSVVVVSVGAGYAYGPQGYSHHALEDIAVMRALPNLEILIPGDSFEATSLTSYLAKTNSPSYLRLGKGNESNINSHHVNLKNGKIHEIINGNSGTILFVGSIGTIAVEASSILEKMGVKVSVASVPFLSNLDFEYMKQASLKGPIVSIEEHSGRGGFGGCLLEFLNREKITSRFTSISANQFNLSQVGSRDFLRNSNGLTATRVVEEFISLMESSS